ncbi:MAG: amino acid ABC transporter permease [Xenococcaceae cyanobacterium]
MSNDRSLVWFKKNLFNSWYNTALTFISLLFVYWFLSGLINWLVTQAQWTVINANLRLFFVGRYPAKAIWRPWMSLAIIVSLSGFTWSILARSSRLFERKNIVVFSIIAAIFVASIPIISINSSILLIGMLGLFILVAFFGKQLGKKLSWLSILLAPIWLISYFLVYWLLTGGLFLRPTVRLDSLSGLILTLLIAITSILLCFPFGVLLALGRQSKLPVISWLSTAYIEILRGLPLIGILFMAQVMLPLILPPNVRPDRVVRAIAGYTLFTAAYVAENVRGGLQSIPRGQTEAAKALGLNTPLTLLLVVLPQAIRAVIPSTVGQFISLFKDTSLLALVGLTDLLGISQSILANPKYLGKYTEVYLFIAVIYWLGCYSMSLASKRLEKQLNQ